MWATAFAEQSSFYNTFKNIEGAYCFLEMLKKSTLTVKKQRIFFVKEMFLNGLIWTVSKPCVTMTGLEFYTSKFLKDKAPFLLTRAR